MEWDEVFKRAGGGGEHGMYDDEMLLMLVVCGGRLGHVTAMNKVLTLSIKPDPHPPEK